MQLPACPVETTLMLIGDKWKVLILRDLMDGTKRFGELKKSIGHVTQKVLTAQLRDMEANGLLTRTVYAEVPVVYIYPIFKSHVISVFITELCSMKHEPFMRMCTHGFHAVFHGEMAVGGADAIAGCLSQVSDDLILHVE